MKITTEIEWFDPIMVPGEDELVVLCAVVDGEGKRVTQAIWSGPFGKFFVATAHGIEAIDPVRWAYMPDFPEEP